MSHDTEGLPFWCEDPRCAFCAIQFMCWWKERMLQMSWADEKKGEKTPFSEAAATSVRPPKE